VLVSSINQLRNEGASLHHAVLQGAARRLRPVLMTESRIRSHGYFHFNWSRGPAAPGDGRDWRIDEFNFADFVFVAHILRLVR
jgi:hypothetical protein